MITRTTNDITQIQMVVAMGLQVMIKAPIMAVWAVCKIIGKSWQLSVVTASAVVLLITTIIVLLAVMLPKFKIVQKQIDDLNRVTRENLTGLRVIRAFNAEKYQEDKFEKASEALMETQMFTMRGMSFLFPVMILVQSGLTLAIYWLGAYLINDITIPLAGTLSSILTAITSRADMLGDVVAFTSYAMYVVMSFVLLMAIFMILPRAQVSASRINEVLDAPISAPGKNAKPPTTSSSCRTKTPKLPRPKRKKPNKPMRVKTAFICLCLLICPCALCYGQINFSSVNGERGYAAMRGTYDWDLDNGFILSPEYGYYRMSDKEIDEAGSTSRYGLGVSYELNDTWRLTADGFWQPQAVGYQAVGYGLGGTWFPFYRWEHITNPRLSAEPLKKEKTWTNRTDGSAGLLSSRVSRRRG